MTQQHRRMRSALAALGSVTLTAGILAASAPTAHANGDDEKEVKVTEVGGTQRIKHAECDFDVVTKGFEDGRLGNIAFFAIEPSAEHQPLFSDVGVPLHGVQNGAPAPGLPGRNTYDNFDLGLDNVPVQPSVLRARGNDVHILVQVKTKNGKTWHYKFWLQVDATTCD